MSKHNNVNPDYYKIAGRDRPNDAAAARLAVAAAAKIASRGRPSGMPKAKTGPAPAGSRKKKSGRAGAD